MTLPIIGRGAYVTAVRLRRAEAISPNGDRQVSAVIVMLELDGGQTAGPFAFAADPFPTS